MGCYINSDTLTKEEWLRRNGMRLGYAPEWDDAFCKTHLFVCLVDNGHWKAAGVAFDKHELKRFIVGLDNRPHKWYAAPIDKLEKVSPIKSYLEKARE